MSAEPEELLVSVEWPEPEERLAVPCLEAELAASLLERLARPTVSCVLECSSHSLGKQTAVVAQVVLPAREFELPIVSCAPGYSFRSQVLQTAAAEPLALALELKFGLAPEPPEIATTAFVPECSFHNLESQMAIVEGPETEGLEAELPVRAEAELLVPAEAEVPALVLFPENLGRLPKGY